MKKISQYNNIITVANLLRAWEEFLRGKKKKEDVALFQNRLMDNIFDIHRDLKEKTYTHGGYVAFKINDPKPRDIHKATVRDRLVHHLLYRELYGYFDSKFIYDSYSCRKGKGTHKAINRFRDFGKIVSKNNTRPCFVLKGDIRRFFANIDHILLKTILEKHIEDKELLRLLDCIINSFNTEGKYGVGLPLGNLTSQLLVNIYMNEFDQFVKHGLKVKYYIRYADDFVFLSEDKEYLESLVPQIAEFLEAYLKLTLHPDKLFLSTLASGVDFLGWVHFQKHRVLRTATKRRMLLKIKSNLENEAVVVSYKGMLSHGNGYKLIKEIESKTQSCA